MTDDQPIGNEDGRYQAIQNGKIYNYVEMRNRLSDRGDTFEGYDRIVEMYEDWPRRAGALPWPVVPAVTASPRVGTNHIHDV